MIWTKLWEFFTYLLALLWHRFIRWLGKYKTIIRKFSTDTKTRDRSLVLKVESPEEDSFSPKVGLLHWLQRKYRLPTLVSKVTQIPRIAIWITWQHGNKQTTYLSWSPAVKFCSEEQNIEIFDWKKICWLTEHKLSLYSVINRVSVILGCVRRKLFLVFGANTSNTGTVWLWFHAH